MIDICVSICLFVNNSYYFPLIIVQTLRLYPSLITSEKNACFIF